MENCNRLVKRVRSIKSFALNELSEEAEGESGGTILESPQMAEAVGPGSEDANDD